jgi:hypothetical protein
VYSSVLVIHSWLRWITLLLAIGATINSLRADHDLTQKPPGRQWDTFFMLALDLQVLFGLLLYFGLSPLTKFAMNNPGSVLESSALSYWALVHLGVMVLATALVRVGRVLAITAKTSQSRRTRRFVWFLLTTVTIMAGIPWPSLSIGRPLFRF